MEVEAVLEAAVAVLEAVVVVVALVAVEGVSVAVATEDPEVAVEEEVAATSPLEFTEAGEIAVLLLHIQKKKMTVYQIWRSAAAQRHSHHS